MPGWERIADGLRYQRERTDLLAWSDALWPELLLRFRVEDGRLHPASLVLDGRHATDLSGQPSAVTAMLREAANQIGANPDGWYARLASRIEADATALGCDASPSRPNRSAEVRLLATLGGLRYPLLGAAYGRGCSVERFVPRWARPALHEFDGVGACRALFGVKATRSLVRATSTWLTTPTEESGRLGWGSLAIALAGADVLEPDDIAGALDRSEGQEVTVASVDDVALMRLVGQLLGGRVFKAVAFEALEHDRVEKLLKVCELLRRVRPLLCAPYPSQLDELERRAMTLAIIDVQRANRPPNPPPPAPTPEVVAPAPVVPTRPRRRFEQAQGAPAAPRRGPGVSFDYAPSVRALNDLQVGPVVLVLPETPQHLVAWSRALRNCLDDYVGPVASGASTIIGIRLDHALIGALEIDRSGRLRQFLGTANRVLPRTVIDPVVRDLQRRGVISAVA